MIRRQGVPVAQTNENALMSAETTSKDSTGSCNDTKAVMATNCA